MLEVLLSIATVFLLCLFLSVWREYQNAVMVTSRIRSRKKLIVAGSENPQGVSRARFDAIKKQRLAENNGRGFSYALHPSQEMPNDDTPIHARRYPKVHTRLDTV